LSYTLQSKISHLLLVCVRLIFPPATSDPGARCNIVSGGTSSGGRRTATEVFKNKFL
jgi:hypothetical protein